MEKAFEKILLAYDNSPAAKAALQSAYGVHTRFNSQISALVVSGDDSNEIASKEALKVFAAEKGISIEIIEGDGKVYDEVERLEKSSDFGLILLGSHGVSGWKKLFVGSNAFKVVSKSTCPTITVTAKASSPELKHILLPLSEDRNTRQKVPYCITMAKAFGATVHILGASTSKSEDTLRRIRGYVNQTETFLLERGVKCTTHFDVSSKVADLCINYAEEVGAGLMVIMAETDSSGIFMDTYSEKLVNTSTVPVMCVHEKDTRLAGSAGY